MGGFTVEPDAVKTFAQQLKQLAADLSSAGTVSSLSDAETGSHDLTGALRSFNAHWASGRNQIIDNIGKLAETVTLAGDGYDEADHAVATATDAG